MNVYDKVLRLGWGGISSSLAQPAGALVATTIGAVADETEAVFMNTGTITMEAGAEEDGDGSIQWSIAYTALAPGARVVPAPTD